MRSRRDGVRAVPPSVARAAASTALRPAEGSTLTFQEAAPLALETGLSETRKPWRKQLYEKQPFPDNHVDDSFHLVLELATTTPTTPDIWRLMARASVVSLPVSSTFALLAVFIALLKDALAPSAVMWTCLFGGLGGYCLYWALCDVKPERHPIRETIITLILLHSLSPILRTLTEATTSDSIWPLSGVLFALGLILVNHSGSSDGSDGTLSSSLSLTSRLSGSVVLASRLPTNTHVFAFILCALMLFALSPMLARQLTTVAFPLSVVWFAATLALLFLVARSPTSAAIFTIVHIGLVVLGPAALVCSWSEKSVIRGDWDVARPIVRRDAPGDS